MNESSWFVKVPNTKSGKLFIELFKEYLNPAKKVRVRDSNRQALYKVGIKRTHCKDIPNIVAESLVLYIDDKPKKQPADWKIHIGGI